jgi:inhibitor of KinA sporulation pathway (predicted exonuclease)
MSLKPVDFSIQTFEDLKSSLNEIRQRVHRAWLAHGPGTTREVATASGIDLLIFRPRTTELFHLGLVELLENVGMNEGRNHQGVYRARTMEQWEKFIAAKRIHANPQLSLTV